MASVVDRPKESSQKDLLKIEKYSNGLIHFIESSATPITIGVQGEWGSGKTSLLNTIRQELCSTPSSEHFAVWLNTWEYSLLSTPDETLIKIIIGLIDQIGTLTKKDSDESVKKLGMFARAMLKQAKGAGGVIGMAAGMADDVIDANSSESENTIRELRDTLQDVIDQALKSHNKRAFIFFIDDLDRLDPAVAVSILELIKNLFDLNKCIFVLAIDYNVVVKGLQSKFGVMTAQNEWEFRAFFDKIIQLPFSMPISSYDISNYLKKLLIEVNYFNTTDLENISTVNKVTEIVNLSVGANPRALKRLANSVALIEIIRGDQKISPEERVIEFALICMQIAYPLIYSLIQREPDFTAWDEQLVYAVLKDQKINISDLDTLKEIEEFDEPWEQNLWKIAQVNSFLKERVFKLSQLLNFIKDNLPNIANEEMSDTIDRLLSMSSVTSVSSDLIQPEKKKFSKVKYDSWDVYKALLVDKKVVPKIIDTIKEISDALKNEYIDTISVTYSPSEINIKNLNSKSAKKVFLYMNVGKKGLRLLIYTDLIELEDITDLQNVKQIKGQYIHVKYNAGESFDLERYMTYIRNGYALLSDGR